MGIAGEVPKYYEALDAKGLALCGLVLISETSEVFENFGSLKPLEAAGEAFAQARAIFSGAGHVGQVLRLFDALAVADEQGVLAGVREVIAGEKQ